MRRRALLGGTGVLAVRLPAARAQSWPQQPLRFIVPFTAGGSIDVIGRIVGEGLVGLLGQPVVIENRPGGNGMIGGTAVARAAPDGYTYLLGATNHAVAPLLQPAPYHPVTDFAAVALLGTFASIAVVRSSLPVSSMRELIDYARTRPGGLNYLNSGNGSTMHLNTELLKLRQRINLVSIPYKGMQAGLTDLLADRLDFAFTVPSLVTQHIQAGRLRALAVGSNRRLAELPEVPTLAELGLSEVQLEAWFMLLGPAALPQDIAVRFNGIVGQALQRPALRQQLAANSLEPAADQPSPVALQAMLAREYARYEKLIQEAGIKDS